MTESIYDSCLLYKSESLKMIEMQTDDILMLVSDAFAEKEEKIIKTINIMTKKQEHFTETNLIKFNDIRIELKRNDVFLNHQAHIDDISLINSRDVNFTFSRDVTKIKLSSKNQYVAQRARDAYIASIS